MRDISRFKINIFLAICFMSAIIFNPLTADAARKKPLHTGKDVKGITYEEFWSKVREDGTKWAGNNRLRVRKIISVPVVGFDGRTGRSPVWEAQIVRCDRKQLFDEDDKTPVKSCKGKIMTLRLVEAGVIGATPGMQVAKETYFRGFSVPAERLRITPTNAEETANAYKQYNPTEIDSYGYELKYDQRRDKPVWVIKRTCGYKGKAEGRCQPGDYWIVKVDAESGGVIKPGTTPPGSTRPADADDDD